MSTILDFGAGGSLPGAGASSMHSTSTRSQRLNHSSRGTSPSALSVKSGSTSCSAGRLSASEIKRVLDKLKAELDSERMKNKQLVKERAAELKKLKSWFEKEKQAALEALQHDLKRDMEKAARESAAEWRQAVKARDEEIRLLREDLKAATAVTGRDKSTSGNEEFILRLQKEIRALRVSQRDLEEKYQKAIQADTSTSAEILLLKTVKELLQDLDAQVNSETFFASGSVPDLPDTLKQLKDQVRRLANFPEAERERLRQMERGLVKLRKENEDLKKQQERNEASSVATSSSVAAAEDKVKKLKRRNAELVANARLIEKSLKSLQQQRRQQPVGSESHEDALAGLRAEFERARARDLAEHAKAMLQRDKALEALRRRLVAESGNPAATTEAMEAMLKTAQRERLQLEKQLSWFMHKEGSGSEANGAPPGGAAELPILQEKLKIISERLKARDQEKQALSQQLESAIARIEELEESVAQSEKTQRDCQQLRRDTAALQERNRILDRELKEKTEEKTGFAVQLCDLQTRVESFDKVEEEKRRLEASLHDLKSAFTVQQAEHSRMRQHMAEMEELVQHLREVADKRRTLETDKEELKRQLQMKEEQISALNYDKTELCRSHEETVEGLRARLREMDKRCELQTLQHEEAMLELEALRKKQHYKQQQEEQLQQLRQQQEEEEERRRREKEEEEEEAKRAKERAEQEEASFVENLTASLKSPLPSELPVTGLSNGTKRLASRLHGDASDGGTGGGGGGLPNSSLRIFTAKYSYDPYQYSPNDNPDLELCLKSGEYLIVHGDMDVDGFYHGELMDGRRGLVPSNFVAPVDITELGPDFNLSAILGRPDGASNGSDDEKSVGPVILERAAAVSALGRLSALPAVPPPCLLKVERLLADSAVVAWQPPMAPHPIAITAYHVYVDGQFETSIKVGGKTRALVKVGDTRKPHRVSVRSVAATGQSKDAECCLQIGQNASPAPEQLKATQIGVNSAKLSWVPGDSKLAHSVVVNGREVKTLPPGGYKVQLNRLTPDTLHRVVVVARTNSAIANPPSAEANMATVEFRTLSGARPDPPLDVQVEEGTQENCLLVTWVSVALEKGGQSNGVKVEGYTIFVDGKRICEVPGATADHQALPLERILLTVGDPRASKAALTVRTRACDGTESTDNSPPVEISLTAAPRPRSTLTAHRRVHGVSPAHRPSSQVGKSPTEDINSLESPPIPMKNVPEIHIIDPELRLAEREEMAALSDGEPRPGGHMARGPRVSDRRSHRRRQQQHHNQHPPHHNQHSPHHNQHPSPHHNQHPPHHNQHPPHPNQHPPHHNQHHSQHPQQHHNQHQPPHNQHHPPHHSPSHPQHRGQNVESERAAWDRRADDEADRELEEVMFASRRSPLQAGVSPTEQMNATYHQNDWAPPRPGKFGPNDVRMFVALYDYDPNTMSPNPDAATEELPFREGQLIRIYGDRDEDGFFYGECGNQRGLVPCNMVTELEPGDPGMEEMLAAVEGETGGRSVMRLEGGAYQQQAPPPVGPRGQRVRRMVALYDYDPHELSPNVDADDMELAFCTGDVILVCGDMDDDGFYFGECMATGRQGLVPSNFLQEVPSRSPSPYHHQGGGNLLHQSSDDARPPGNSREGGRRPKAAIRADSSTSASSVSGPGMTSHYGAPHGPPHDSQNSSSSSSRSKVRDHQGPNPSRPSKAVMLPPDSKLLEEGPGMPDPSAKDMQKRTKLNSGGRVKNEMQALHINTSSQPNPKVPPLVPATASSASSLASRSPEVTPESTPTPTKKSSAPSSQPSTPHSERKRSSVFKNPFKKKKS